MMGWSSLDSWPRLFSAQVTSPKTGRRVSYSTCTREKGTHSTVGTTVAWSSQTRSWSCWNGPWTSTFARWWTSMKCSSFCARKRHHRCHLHRPPDPREAPSRKQAPLLRLCWPGKGLRPHAKEGAMVGPKERRRGGMVDPSHPRHVH